jgi:cytochrome c biogenesis protein CcdA
MMNIAVLAGVTALIFAEKSTAWGRQIARAAAVALIVYGAVVVFVPDALPMMMDDSTMAAETMDSDNGMQEDETGGSGGGIELMR